MPEYISKMLDLAVAEDVDIVIGSRFVNKCKEVSARMLGSRIITVAIKLATGKRVPDPTSGMRMFNRKMIERLASDDSLNPEPESISNLMKKVRRFARSRLKCARGRRGRATIKDDTRTHEDFEMLCRFWPRSLARIVNWIYGKSQTSNNVKEA